MSTGEADTNKIPVVFLVDVDHTLLDKDRLSYELPAFLRSRQLKLSAMEVTQ